MRFSELRRRPERHGIGWRLGAALGALCVTAVLALGVPTARASTWIGSSRGALIRSSNLVSGGTRWQGTFRFTVGRGGVVHGYAVTGFDPQIDVSGLDNAIDYIRGVVGAGFGLLGPFAGPVSAVGLGSIIGVSVSFNDAMAIRRGPLTGYLDHGRLALHWGVRLGGIGYQIELELPGSAKVIGTGSATLSSPFAQAVGSEDSGEIVAVSRTHDSSNGIAESLDSYWVAHRTS